MYCEKTHGGANANVRFMKIQDFNVTMQRHMWYQRVLLIGNVSADSKDDILHLTFVSIILLQNMLDISADGRQK